MEQENREKRAEVAIARNSSVGFPSNLVLKHIRRVLGKSISKVLGCQKFKWVNLVNY